MQVDADTKLEKQRKLYLAANQSLETGQITRFKQLTNRLKDYPLYPYLLYNYLRARLWKLTDEEIAGFLKHYGDLPMANDIRRSWLTILAKRGHWETFLRHYTPQSDVTLQCYQLQARIRTGNDTYLIEDTRSIWLAGKSQPDQCDAPFERLYRSGLLSTEDVWTRFELAMDSGQTSLARYVSRRLPAEQQPWAERWLAARWNPDKITREPGYEDTEIARKVLLYAMHRLAAVNVDAAISRWDALESDYSFTQEQISDMRYRLGVKATQQKHHQAKALLDRIDDSRVDEEVFEWRLRAALDDYDWDRLLHWTSGTAPQDEGARGPWLYWRGRALEATGKTEEAREVYAKLLEQRDYYGFLGADRLGVPYDMQHHPLPEDLPAWQKISEMPGILRARELFLLGKTYHARREWQHVLNNLTTYQLQIAAMIASNWGWHDQVIFTMGKARSFDDLVLRFPTPFEKDLSTHAARFDLDPAWVFSIVRAESAFNETARSPAGAMGLMQVMPATGNETAKNIGMKNFNPPQLYYAETNIPIGTAYMKQMYERFNGNIIVATAAYNAGPGNVGSWLPKTGCVEGDVWVEKIPFKETRRYVRRVLYYASIYDWRLSRDVTPVAGRMASVVPRSGKLVADLSCSRPTVSMN